MDSLLKELICKRVLEGRVLNEDLLDWNLIEKDRHKRYRMIRQESTRP